MKKGKRVLNSSPTDGVTDVDMQVKKRALGVGVATGCSTSVQTDSVHDMLYIKVSSTTWPRL